MRRLPGDVWKAMARAHPALLLILLLPTLVLPVSFATADEEPTPAPIAPAPPDLGTLERDYLATLDRHDQRAYAEQRRLLFAIADLQTSAAKMALRDLLETHGRSGDRVRTLHLLAAIVRRGGADEVDQAIRFVERARDELLLESLGKVLAAAEERGARHHLVNSALKRATPEVKAQILRALGALGNSDAGVPIMLLLRDDNLRIRIEAMNALGLLRDLRAMPIIRTYLGYRDENRQIALLVRRAAARALGMIGTEAVIRPLIGALDDESPRVVEAAAQALGIVGLPQAVPALIAGLERTKDSDLRTADAFASALHRISGKPLGLDIELWQSWWSIMKDQPFVRVEDEQGGGTVAGVRYYGFPVRSNRVVFVLDVSRSMGWNERLDTAKTELERTLSALPQATMFSVVSYADVIYAWKKKLTPAKPSNVKDAIRWIKARRAMEKDWHKKGDFGGTNTHGALMRAFAFEDVDTVFFLTDGHPTTGEIVDPELILARVRKRNRYLDVRIHGIALTRGEPPPAFAGRENRDTSTAFMKRLAEENNGDFLEIR